MVFEAAALYPHLTTAQNLRFGLALRKLPDEEIASRSRPRPGSCGWELP